MLRLVGFGFICPSRSGWYVWTRLVRQSLPMFTFLAFRTISSVTFSPSNDFSSNVDQVRGAETWSKRGLVSFSHRSNLSSDAALESYSEERCEPSNPIYRNQGTQRNCPDLSTWDAFVNYEIGDGIDTFDALKPNIKLPKLPKLPSADEISNRVYDKVTGLKKKRAALSDNQWTASSSSSLSAW